MLKKWIHFEKSVTLSVPIHEALVHVGAADMACSYNTFVLLNRPIHTEYYRRVLVVLDACTPLQVLALFIIVSGYICIIWIVFKCILLLVLLQ